MTDEYADRLEEAVSQVVALGFSTGHADTFEGLCLECVGNLADMRMKLADKQDRIDAHNARCDEACNVDECQHCYSGGTAEEQERLRNVRGNCVTCPRRWKIEE